MLGSCRLKALLVGKGRPASSMDLYNELLEAQKKNGLRFATAETTVGSVEHIRKLLRVSEVATAAGVLPLLTSLQVCNGERTWVTSLA